MAILYDNSVSSGVDSNSVTKTVSFTCSGSDRLLIVFVFVSGSTDRMTSVTYNGVTMTKLAGGTDNGMYFRGYFYYLLNPSYGTNNIVVNLNSSEAIGLSAVSYTGVKQTGFPNVYTTNIPTNSSPWTTSVTTTQDNCWTVLAVVSRIYALTAGSGSTIRTSTEINCSIAIFDSNGVISPAGSKSMTVNGGQEGHSYIVMAGFEPSPTQLNNSNFFQLF